ncbi:MAG: hypothetical protein KQH57_17275 [Actinomycetales bacterium]|nr:hypothetical protein [Actinomycetales bacterium]
MTTPEWNPNPFHPGPTGARLAEMRAALDALGAPAPEPLVRGERLLTIAAEFVAEKPTPLLELAEADVRDDIVMRSIRRHKAPDGFNTGRSAGLDSGLITFESQLVSEVQAACLPLIDDIIAGQREEFDKPAAALVTAAREYGFTMRTTSDDVIDFADEAASAAWRATRPAWAKLDRYHTALRRLLRAFEVETATASPEPPDLSVYFAAAGNWSDDGAHYLEHRTDAGVDWFALAAGGLRLNTPSEVADMRQAKAS